MYQWEIRSLHEWAVGNNLLANGTSDTVLDAVNACNEYMLWQVRYRGRWEYSIHEIAGVLCDPPVVHCVCDTSRSRL